MQTEEDEDVVTCILGTRPCSNSDLKTRLKHMAIENDSKSINQITQRNEKKRHTILHTKIFVVEKHANLTVGYFIKTSHSSKYLFFAVESARAMKLINHFGIFHSKDDPLKQMTGKSMN